MVLPTTTQGFNVGEVRVNWTQVIALALGVVVTVGTAAFLQFTKLGTAMRSLANDREITADARRARAARRGGGVARLRAPVAGVAGLLLSNLVGLDAVDADVPGHLVAGGGADRAAAVAVVTFVAGLVDRAGQRAGDADPVDLAVPRHDAVRARDRRAAVAVAPRDASPAQDAADERGRAPERHRTGARPAGAGAPIRAARSDGEQHPRDGHRRAVPVRAVGAAADAERLLDHGAAPRWPSTRSSRWGSAC